MKIWNKHDRFATRWGCCVQRAFTFKFVKTFRHLKALACTCTMACTLSSEFTGGANVKRRRPWRNALEELVNCLWLNTLKQDTQGTM